MQISREQRLANKIKLLVDSVNAESGERMTWPIISGGLNKRGIDVSRTTWHYLTAGQPIAWPSDDFLRALADIFGVDPDYLLVDEGPIPDRVEKELALVRAMRRAKVRNFAFRNLSDVDPESLATIMEMLSNEEEDL